MKNSNEIMKLVGKSNPKCTQCKYGYCKFSNNNMMFESVWECKICGAEFERRLIIKDEE